MIKHPEFYEIRSTVVKKRTICQTLCNHCKNSKRIW